MSSLLEYSWLQPLLLGKSQLFIIELSVIVVLILLPGKMMLTYYILYDLIKGGLQTGTKLWIISLQIIISLSIVIILNKALFNYFVFPQISNKQIDFLDIFNLYGIIIGIIDNLFIAGLAVAIKLFRMQVLNLEREKYLVREKLETELKFLKSQINPHFLFNTLNNIYVLARKKSDLTSEVVIKLSKLLRFMLYEAKKTEITISEELKIMEDYVQLERIRYTNRLNIEFVKYIDNYNQNITPLILLPFIENAFKHGASETTTKTYIFIDVQLKNGFLNFMVENSKEYIETQLFEEGIGLSNARRQLELMYTDFKLSVNNLKDTFQIELFINLNKNAAL